MAPQDLYAMQSSTNISVDELLERISKNEYKIKIIINQLSTINEDECFKDILGYDGHYKISNYGRVKSLKNGIGRILKASEDTKGYLKVLLYKNGNVKVWRIHQLVAITFLNHKQCGHERVIDHIDGNILNNHVSNLQIITNRENCKKRKDKATYSGVTYDVRNKKFKTGIRINNKRIHFGCY